MPQNLFVAQFIGAQKMNIIKFRDIYNSSNIDQELRDFLLTKKQVANIGIRPEHIKLS